MRDAIRWLLVALAMSMVACGATEPSTAASRRQLPQYELAYLIDDGVWRNPNVCPGPTVGSARNADFAFCTINGSLSIQVGANGPDGDTLIIDIEVVPRDQPFTGVPTTSFTVPPLPGGGWEIPTVPLPRVAPGKYAMGITVRDALGAGVPATLLFEQGPCSGAGCSCVPPTYASTIGCWSDLDCCSGKCSVSHPAGESARLSPSGVCL